jgi:hypothetical protein
LSTGQTPSGTVHRRKDRPPRYRSPVHRRQAWELRTAQARAERPVDDGGRSRESAKRAELPRKELGELELEVARLEAAEVVFGQ